MKKRIVAMLMAATMCAGALAGCGSSTSGSSTSGSSTSDSGSTTTGGDTSTGSSDSSAANGSLVDNLIAATEGTVSLTVWQSESVQDFTKQKVEDFKALYPDIDFDITIEQESESTAKDTVLTDVTAAADVYAFADDQITALVKNGALQAVTSYTYDVASANKESTIDAATVNGTLYAYPMTADNTYYMFYDKSVFSEDDIKDLDTMIDKAAAAGKKIAFEFANGWYLYGWFAGAGLEAYLDEDNNINICNWNTGAGPDVAQAIADYCAGGVLVNSTDDSSTVTGVKEGTYAAVINGIWNSGSFQEAWGDNYGAAKMPEFSAGGNKYQLNSFFSCKMVGVNPHSENVGWAMVLAEYLTSEETQIERFEAVGWGPSNINASNAPAVQTSADIVAVGEQTQFAQPQRIGDNFWTPAATLGSTLCSGSAGDLQSLLDEAVTGITAPVTTE